jgi:hypothetical protein
MFVVGIKMFQAILPKMVSAVTHDARSAPSLETSGDGKY